MKQHPRSSTRKSLRENFVLQRTSGLYCKSCQPKSLQNAPCLLWSGCAGHAVETFP